MKKINLDLSFFHLFTEKNNWRTNIKSVLTFNDNSLFLVKECWAETIHKFPFKYSGRYEYLAILDDFGGVNIFRTCSNFSEFQLNKSIKSKKNIIENDIKYIPFKKTHNIFTSCESQNIFCEIEFEYENIFYTLISKCEYMNYNNSKSKEKYLQPIIGYIPFISNKRLSFGYISFHIKEKSDGNLQILLFEKSQKFKVYKDNYMIKKLIKKLLNSLNDIFFQKNYNFDNIITIEKSNVKFFQYI